MFWSDSTHLTSFGDSKLWPLYMFIGNDSKYRRCKPSHKLCSHIAYFQKVSHIAIIRQIVDNSFVTQLPAAFKDFAAARIGGKGPNDALMTHCHRELMHAQWKILLDDDFMDAYEHGIVFTGHDNLERRFYPRIFTYSADYPEKFVFD